MPSSLVPTGPDLTAGPLAADGLFGAPPPPPLLARLQQTLGAASAVNPAQFPMRDPQFAPGTTGTVAACLFAVLWCAGAPVADADNPIFGLFSRYLSGGRRRPALVPAAGPGTDRRRLHRTPARR